MKRLVEYINGMIIWALLLLLGSTTSEAQVCTGSLGDPVVNVTFGAGGTIGNPLPVGNNNYNFISADCPGDGSYTVISSTGGCFSNSWHRLTEDHTPGDVNGYMMLVNASFTPGDFYVDTVRGLCANTTYEFSAWVINVLVAGSCSPNPIHPKLVFNIESTSGLILGTYSTGDIFETTAPQWNQYGLFFTTPVNANDVVIRLTNNNTGGCGNDLALDDITFRPCGPTITAGTLVAGQQEAHLCAGQSTATVLTALIGSGFSTPSVQWQESLNDGLTWTDIPGATANSYTFNKTAIGNYQYRLSAAEGTNILLTKCRVASNVVKVTIHPLPVITASSNSPVCAQSQLRLSATGAVKYSWVGPGGYASVATDTSFIARQGQAGRYNVSGIDQYGCRSVPVFTEVAIFAKPTIALQDSVFVCEGSSVQLLASGGDTYQWYPPDGLSNTQIANPKAAPGSTTIYTVVAANGNACKDSATVKVQVALKPVANAGADQVILENEPALLLGEAGGSNIRYFWTPPVFLNDPNALQPLSNATSDTTYTLHVVSNAGCGSATDKVLVRVFKQLYVPNAFSPNGDGRNDVWKVDALRAFPAATVTVYNRAGQKLFEGTGAAAAWDGNYKGSPQDAGSYVYIIDFKTKRSVKKGNLLLIR